MGMNTTKNGCLSVDEKLSFNAVIHRYHHILVYFIVQTEVSIKNTCSMLKKRADNKSS